MTNSSEHYFNEFSKQPHFHKVLTLHEEKGDWEALSSIVPFLSRGWYELSQLPSSDRVDFTKDFWFAKLPFLATNGSGLEERLADFFFDLDDIGIFATQNTPQSPFEVHMLYILKDNRDFFMGPLLLLKKLLQL